MSETTTLMIVLLLAGFGINAEMRRESIGFDREANREKNAEFLYAGFAKSVDDWEKWHACQDYYSGAFSSGLRKVMCGENEPQRPRFGSNMSDEEKVIVEGKIYSEPNMDKRRALLDIVRWTEFPPENVDRTDIIKGEWNFPEPTDEQRSCARSSRCRNKFGGKQGQSPVIVGERKEAGPFI